LERFQSQFQFIDCPPAFLDRPLPTPTPTLPPQKAIFSSTRISLAYPHLYNSLRRPLQPAADTNKAIASVAAAVFVSAE